MFPAAVDERRPPALTLTPQPAVRVIMPLGPEVDSDVNMLHMRLFYHFEKHTAPTLVFQPVWDTMIQHSFHVTLATTHPAVALA